MWLRSGLCALLVCACAAMPAHREDDTLSLVNELKDVLERMLVEDAAGTETGGPGHRAFSHRGHNQNWKHGKLTAPPGNPELGGKGSATSDGATSGSATSDSADSDSDSGADSSSADPATSQESDSDSDSEDLEGAFIGGANPDGDEVTPGPEKLEDDEDKIDAVARELMGLLAEEERQREMREDKAALEERRKAEKASEKRSNQLNAAILSTSALSKKELGQLLDIMETRIETTKKE